jgi:hypothetical protein
VGRSGHGVEEKNSQPPPGTEPRLFDRPDRSLVAIPTELSPLIHRLLMNILSQKLILVWLMFYTTFGRGKKESFNNTLWLLFVPFNTQIHLLIKNDAKKVSM